MRVRDARPEDWPAIWSFVGEIVAAGETFPYDEDMDESEARAMWLLDEPSRTTVAVDAAETVVGSAKMNPNYGGPGAHAASASFMVDPAHWGKGAGRALCEDALNWAREQGYRALQFQRRGRVDQASGRAPPVAGFRGARLHFRSFSADWMDRSWTLTEIGAATALEALWRHATGPRRGLSTKNASKDPGS